MINWPDLRLNLQTDLKLEIPGRPDQGRFAICTLALTSFLMLHWGPLYFLYIQWSSPCDCRGWRWSRGRRRCPWAWLRPWDAQVFSSQMFQILAQACLEVVCSVKLRKKGTFHHKIKKKKFPTHLMKSNASRILPTHPFTFPGKSNFKLLPTIWSLSLLCGFLW